LLADVTLCKVCVDSQSELWEPMGKTEANINFYICPVREKPRTDAWPPSYEQPGNKANCEHEVVDAIRFW